MAGTERTLKAAQLCALTGLTDQRHRQLARDGWFPPPARGVYQLGPTLRGLFRYYRQLTERSGNFHEEREKKTRTERMIAELKLDELRGRLVDVRMLASSLDGATAAIKERVLNSTLTEPEKLELCNAFARIYFDAAAAADSNARLAVVGNGSPLDAHPQAQGVGVG